MAEVEETEYGYRPKHIVTAENDYIILYEVGSASASGATVYRAVSVPSYPEFVHEISVPVFVGLKSLLHKDIHAGHIFIKHAHRHIMLAFVGSIYEHHYIVDENSTPSPSSSSSSSISTWVAAMK
ncbi:hypothetical protein Pint_00331 [Pistacia integerrima]|uniref:Uncharacterized protein n=1 Tax=Pistacia integerrima TaxID=434235 RepID=A0ACC0ZJ21_9ROSI|nr:hypothetical protein Pint_00331 [Pistacia integerrima]